MQTDTKHRLINLIAVGSLWLYLFFFGPFKDFGSEPYGADVLVGSMLVIFFFASAAAVIHDGLTLFMLVGSLVAVVYGIGLSIAFHNIPEITDGARIMALVGVANMLALLASTVLGALFAIARGTLGLISGFLGLSERTLLE